MRSSITPVSECASLGETIWGGCCPTKLEVPGHAYARKSVPGLFLEICFSCSTFFPVSNARN